MRAKNSRGSIEWTWWLPSVIIRTRKRYWQVAFAAVTDRTYDGRFYAFIQFGDWHTFWLRRW
jgi:hypothetical protein